VAAAQRTGMDLSPRCSQFGRPELQDLSRCRRWSMKRRDVLQRLAGGSLLTAAARVAEGDAEAKTLVPPQPAGVPPIRIKDIKVVLTAPNGIRLVLVKVVTDQPGLHGWGCATFTQRALVVQTAIEQYLRPFLIGRRVDEIEDIYQSMYVSSYWRNGPVLFNAMSGVDIALWDILGKRAGCRSTNCSAGRSDTAPTATITPAGARSKKWRTARGTAWKPGSATCACRAAFPEWPPTARAPTPSPADRPTSRPVRRTQAPSEWTKRWLRSSHSRPVRRSSITRGAPRDAATAPSFGRR
jgi:hypothetical protein